METELDRLHPDVEPLTLTTGFTIEVVRMKTRQFFRMLKVITHGAGPRLIEAGLDFKADSAVFATRFAALVAMSIPDAEVETIDFLKSMGQPAGLVSGLYGKPAAQLTKAEAQADDALWGKFNRELFNPDPLDTFALIELIVRREAADVQALGKKLMAMMEVAMKTGQAAEGTPETAPEAGDLHSPELSPASSTS